jgi:hypothetical protein
MLVQSSPRPVSLFSLLSLIAGGVVIVIACYALLAWIIDIDFLRNAIPGWPKMMPAIAFCFILCGFSLCFQRAAASEMQAHAIDWEQIVLSFVSPRQLAQGSALIVILIALLGLGNHYHNLWGLELGGLQIFIPDNLAAMLSGIANQMPPKPSLFFLLVGGALLLLHMGTYRGIRTMQALAMAVLFTVLVAALNYVFGTQIFRELDLWPRMAPHEAFSFVSLSIGLVFARPESGLMGLLTSESLSAYTGRRLLIAVILVPAVIGCLYLFGWGGGFYDARQGLPLLIVLNVLVIFVAVWINAVSLHKREGRRQQDVAMLREVIANLERQVQEQTAEVMRANHDIWSEIQERVRLEEEVRRLSEQLEQEQEQRSLIEQEAQQHTEDAGRLTDEFLSTISEEMQTPLKAILNWVNLLRRRQLTQEESARVLEAIELRTGELLAAATSLGGSLGGNPNNQENDLAKPSLPSLPPAELPAPDPNKPEIVVRF